MSRSSLMGTAIARRKAEEQQQFEEELKAQVRADPRLYRGDPTLPAVVGHHAGGPDYKFKAPRQVK